MSKAKRSDLAANLEWNRHLCFWRTKGAKVDCGTTLLSRRQRFNQHATSLRRCGSRGGRSHTFRHRFRSCSKLFESESGFEIFSNLRIRLPFRLRLPSTPQKFSDIFTLEIDHADCWHCLKWKAFPAPGPKKRRILTESTPAFRMRGHLCVWDVRGANFVDQAACLWQANVPIGKKAKTFSTKSKISRWFAQNRRNHPPRWHQKGNVQTHTKSQIYAKLFV